MNLKALIKANKMSFDILQFGKLTFNLLSPLIRQILILLVLRVIGPFSINFQEREIDEIPKLNHKKFVGKSRYE